MANSNDDSVSVVDTSSRKVLQTVDVNPVPGQSVGSYPNALTMPDASHLLVSIGRDNAVAVYGFTKATAPLTFQGLLPTDWYPVQVQADPALKGQIVVTNDKGIGARGPATTIDQGPGTTPATGGNTYNDTGSVTIFDLPSASQLKQYTGQVFALNGWDGANEQIPAASRPVVPKKIGQGSPIKHVFVIVRENRTYDQVLGDMPEGNGDASLVQFGETVTPNQHALAERFGLFDNFYDEGTLSADGHNWITQADANDYIEKEFGSFYRSYPAQGGDALAYQRSGFLWNAAAKAGLTVADYGEYANFFDVPYVGAPTWTDWYKDALYLEGGGDPAKAPIPVDKYKTYSDIPSLNDIIDTRYPKFATEVPDQYRADIWKMAFAKAEAKGKLANLNFIWLPDDHTSGVVDGYPYPTAAVADNDLALGRIVDTISHSRFWKSTAIFVVEDDPQNGVDHVDGHRTVAWVISPYSNERAVDTHYYSQINMVRTVEQILGIQPMNQEDGTAQPMYTAFGNRPDFRPYNAQPNQVPLTLGVAGFSATAKSAAVAQLTTVPVAEQTVEQKWEKWSAKQNLSGRDAEEDSSNTAQLNRVIWYSATGWKRPYPGDSKILAPNEVPGRSLPADYLGDD